MSEVPSTSMLACPDLHQPDRDTPLTFRVSAADLRQIHAVLIKCPFDRIQPILQSLEAQAQALLQKPQADELLVFRLSYGEYLNVLDILGGLPYRMVASVVHELARLVEAQLHAASHLELNTGRKPS